MDIFFGIINSIIQVIMFSWWFIFPFILFFIFWDLRMVYIRTRFVNSIEWLMLEVKIPKDILKTPKAMEQVFTEMAAIYSFGLTAINVYWEGKVEPWVSFEMVGYVGGVHFYIRTPSKYRNLIESAIYAQYPDAEISQAEDYTDLLPTHLPNKVYDAWGTTFILLKESYYPIRTYHYFEEAQEEKRLDPIAAVAEVMSNLKEGESIWLQILISPTGDHPIMRNLWQKEGQEKIDEIAGRQAAEKSKKGFGLDEWFRNLFWAPMEHPTWGEEKKKETSSMVKFLHPGEQEVVKAISNKIAKLGFETVIRFVYIDKRDSFTSANASAVLGSFHQFNTQDLNFIRPDKKTITLKTGLLAKISRKYKELNEFSRKRRIFDYYKQRRFGFNNKTKSEKFSIFCPEELATIYHFPTMMVEAPRLRKIETKRGGPPAGLPIE